jgi:hypothetical protein
LEITHTFTREQPAGWSGYARRIDSITLKEACAPLGRTTQASVCGPTQLVEAAADGLVLRFPTCSRVILRMVQASDYVYLDSRGAVYLRIGRHTA